MIMAKTFIYGGFTFEPRGQFKDFGIKADRNEFYNITRALHYPNQGYVADGDLPFNYDEFYKASASKDDDVFYCAETGEMYVPSAGGLAVFDQKCSGSEVADRYNRRREEREEREREAKREALKNALCLTTEQHQAYIDLRKAIKECQKLGLEFAYDGSLSVYRADLLKDVTTDMAPMQGQVAVDYRSFLSLPCSIRHAPDGLYANVKD